MEILHIENLSFSYPNTDKKALDNVTFSVNKGEFIVLCGKSGCGKSTLLKLLKKEISPYGTVNGEIKYNGTALSETDDRTSVEEIGFVMQNPESGIVTDTVWHELAFTLENLGVSTKIIRRKVAEMASFFGIEEWFHKKTSELSGGQKQLLNLAAVMVANPKVLLLDEPTAQLDPISAANFIATLKKINRELGLTVVLAEHRLEEVFPLADKVLMLESGKKEFFDNPKNIVSYFEKNPKNDMRFAMPSAIRIFSRLEKNGACPITVREGRQYISSNYKNETKALKVKPYSHSEQKAVELKDVFFRYSRDLPDILKGISLEIYKGEHFCVLGGNGTGKTTTLKVICGILKAYKGKILINGKKISDYKQNELYINNLSLLPQDPADLFLSKTVYEDLLESCNTMNFDKNTAKKRIEEVSQTLGIADLLNSHPYDLSGGEQQKAAIGKVLILNPQILLLDEPTKGIDACGKQTLAEIIKTLKQNGITVITVTHDIEFAALCADRVGLFFDGDLVSVDTVNNFFTQNSFYTTAANRISRDYFENAVLCDDVVKLCLINGKKAVTNNE